MNSLFKQIIFCIIFCLTAIFVWQIYWLEGLYHSIKQEQNTTVLNCIADADRSELIARINALQKNRKTNMNNQITLNFNPIDAASDETVSSSDPDRSSKTYSFEKNIDSFEQLSSQLVLILHRALDSISPPNLNSLDSFTNVFLKNREIGVKVRYTELIDLKTMGVIRKSQIDSFIYAESTTHTDLQSFIFKYDPNQRYAYRVYTDSLAVSVLIRMSGILFTTLLIVLLLSFAFWYLIRTVLRQKSLEEMKEDFTNNMTHELKTPIAVAYAATDALLNFHQDADLEKRKAYLNICKEQLFKLSTLVEQILSMSMEQRKLLSLNIKDIPIKSLINKLIEQHQLRANKPTVFHSNIDPENLTVMADRTHLTNMISNLMDNSIKYSTDKAEVWIDVYQNQTWNIIKVRDHGIGISAEQQKNIFDRFYRIPKGNLHETSGYGLGLYYVKTMAEKHGGTVIVESVIGNGSTFTIQIPKNNGTK